MILDQLSNPSKITRRRVGLAVSKGAPARAHTPVLDAAGNKVGEVCSGTFGPSIQANIAMAYVSAAHAKVGTELQVDVRGKTRPATVAPMPFTPHTYKR